MSFIVSERVGCDCSGGGDGSGGVGEIDDTKGISIEKYVTCNMLPFFLLHFFNKDMKLVGGGSVINRAYPV